VLDVRHFRIVPELFDGPPRVLAAADGRWTAPLSAMAFAMPLVTVAEGWHLEPANRAVPDEPWPDCLIFSEYEASVFGPDVHSFETRGQLDLRIPFVGIQIRPDFAARLSDWQCDLGADVLQRAARPLVNSSSATSAWETDIDTAGFQETCMPILPPISR